MAPSRPRHCSVESRDCVRKSSFVDGAAAALRIILDLGGQLIEGSMSHYCACKTDVADEVRSALLDVCAWCK